jgi:hypothetical protein
MVNEAFSVFIHEVDTNFILCALNYSSYTTFTIYHFTLLFFLTAIRQLRIVFSDRLHLISIISRF